MNESLTFEQKQELLALDAYNFVRRAFTDRSSLFSRVLVKMGRESPSRSTLSLSVQGSRFNPPRLHLKGDQVIPLQAKERGSSSKAKGHAGEEDHEAWAVQPEALLLLSSAFQPHTWRKVQSQATWPLLLGTSCTPGTELSGVCSWMGLRPSPAGIIKACLNLPTPLLPLTFKVSKFLHFPSLASTKTSSSVLRQMSLIILLKTGLLAQSHISQRQRLFAARHVFNQLKDRQGRTSLHRHRYLSSWEIGTRGSGSKPRKIQTHNSILSPFTQLKSLQEAGQRNCAWLDSFKAEQW